MFEWPHIIEFWFGPLDSDGLPDREHRQRWFEPSRSFDREIRRRFLSMMLLASEGALESWRQAPGGRLAEILLLDQVPRNIHRGTALAYDYDRQARQLCRDGLEVGADLELPLIGRCFFYMPLQHSEKSADQQEAVGLYEQALAVAENERLKNVVREFYRSAQSHRDIVARFGRFPHRNRILKRQSTSEETVYLASGADNYGQG